MSQSLLCGGPRDSLMQVPSFVSLHASGAARSPRTRSPRLEFVRPSHTPSEVHLSHLLAPRPPDHVSAQKHLVQHMTEVARTRLNPPELAALRDNFTMMLQTASGTTNVTAVRASRRLETCVRERRPVSVHEVCSSFSGWPPTVQHHFMHQLLVLSGAPCIEDNHADDLPQRAQEGSAGATTLASHGRLPASSATPRSTALNPLGLALPAIRGRVGGGFVAAKHSLSHADGARGHALQPITKLRAATTSGDASPDAVQGVAPPEAASSPLSPPAGMPLAPIKRTPSPDAQVRERRRNLCDAVASAFGDGQASGAVEELHKKLAAVNEVLLGGVLDCEHALVCVNRAPEGDSGSLSTSLHVAAIDSTAMPAVLGDDERTKGEGDVVAGPEGLVGGFVGTSVLETGEAVCLQQAEADPRFNTRFGAAALGGVKVRNLVSAPIPNPYGSHLRPLGVIELLNASAEWGFAPSAQADLATVCTSIAPLVYSHLVHAPDGKVLEI